MSFERFEYEAAGESYYLAKHSSGLTVAVIPKPDKSKSYALFATKYGSIDSTFSTGANDAPVTVPDGIAHFLEHKLFESEKGNAFDLFAKTGASANAFTSFDMTGYLFSATDKVYESLKILLDFVRAPHFTKESVEKEQGIIGQEIKMYLDNPGNRVFYGMLEGLYHNNPVRRDIAGTVESIGKITPELLYTCYRAFYNLNNMVLCVSGNVEPEKVLELCDNSLFADEKKLVCSKMPEEPRGILNKNVTNRLSVSIPLFEIGVKDNSGALSGREAAKVTAVTRVLLDIIAGKASPLYKKLYESGLINDSFSAEYFAGRTFAVSMFGGESKEPEKVYAAVLEEFGRVKAEGIDKDAFLRAKKSLYGGLVYGFDDVEQVANGFVDAYLMGMGPFDILKALAEVTAEDAEKRLREHFVPEMTVLSQVLPV